MRVLVVGILAVGGRRFEIQQGRAERKEDFGPEAVDRKAGQQIAEDIKRENGRAEANQQTDKYPGKAFADCSDGGHDDTDNGHNYLCYLEQKCSQN